MKKFISMVMAAAMVVSLVPATAFAVDADLTGKYDVLKEIDLPKGDDGKIDKDEAPELRITIEDADWKVTEGPDTEVEVVVTLDNAAFDKDNLQGKVVDKDGKDTKAKLNYALDFDNTELTITTSYQYKDGDVIVLDLISNMDKVGAGKTATVMVESDDVVLSNDGVEMVYATIVDKAFKASIKKMGTVAEEEVETLERALVVKSAVGDLPDTFTLKLNKGFEFVDTADNEMEITTANYVKNNDNTKVEIPALEIEATTAKAGDVATIKVTAKNWDSASVEVLTVVDYKVVMSVDPDEDTPVMYSGVNAAGAGLNDDDNHWSQVVTIEETFPGAWSMRKGFTLELPEGVYVTAVDVEETDGLYVDEKGDKAKLQVEEDVEAAFTVAYQKGKHVKFDFVKRVWNDVDTVLNKDCAKIVFTLELVADPGFEGDAVLKLAGDLVDEQEVVIAKFVTPYTVKAEQNDVIIDYRYTEVETPIVITEAEAGLWNKEVGEDFFTFTVDRGDMIQFEDTADIAVNEDSGMEVEIANEADKASNGIMTVDITEESDEEAAEVTISGIELFMQRNIPAGAYDLTIDSYMADMYDAQVLLGQKAEAYGKVRVAACTHSACIDGTASNCADVADYSATVKEAWVNVVTAGRDVDDASFTTKVLVPIGENVLYAGDKAYTLDVPAYINADGYTMLPVRAVAVALGISNDAVQWDAATKTVIIMYGQRVITMTAGQKVIYASGTAIPAKSAVEIVDGRAFLGLRDLATALGVTKIDYVDGVASLN